MPRSYVIPMMISGAAFALVPISYPSMVPIGADATAAGAPPILVDLPDRGHQIAMSRDGLYYIDAKAGGGEVHLLVDSGANTTVLTKADARRLGVRMEGLRFQGGLRTAQGLTSFAPARLPALTLAGRAYRDVPVAVSGIENGTSLLGQDMIRRFRHLAIDDGVMTLL